MEELLLVGLAGFLAAMVDGALGMGFGPTSSTVLLSTGLSPVAVSATVNLAKVASGLASGVSHWQFRNIDHGLVRRLALSGAVGAVIGVTVLANVPADTLRPILALLLFLVGVRMLYRFSYRLPSSPDDRAPDPNAEDDKSAFDFDDRGTNIVGMAGGVTNGMIGAWGPVVTPFLLHRGLAPRYAVGSVNTAEVAVAVVAAGSLFASIGGSGVELGIVLAMMVGGVLAAPLAAWVIRFVPPRAMGLAVAGLLLASNMRELAGWADLGDTRWVVYALAPLLVGFAAIAPRARERVAELRAGESVA